MCLRLRPTFRRATAVCVGGTPPSCTRRLGVADRNAPRLRRVRPYTRGMCTLVVAFRMYPGVPLLVAANRDERLDRASRGPFVWPGPPRFIAPRDEVSGGSWLGLNEHGLFVGITNRAGAPPDPRRRSRGELVIDALHASTARDAHDRLSSLAPETYNPFHLLYADSRSAHLSWSDGTTLHRDDLAPGLHVVTERSAGAPDTPRAVRIRRAWESLGADAPDVAAVQALLAEHDHDRPLDAICVHTDAVGYGTRSSMILTLPEDAAQAKLLWAEGKPCRSPFVDLSALLAEIG